VSVTIEVKSKESTPDTEGVATPAVAKPKDTSTETTVDTMTTLASDSPNNPSTAAKVMVVAKASREAKKPDQFSFSKGDVVEVPSPLDNSDNPVKPVDSDNPI